MVDVFRIVRPSMVPEGSNSPAGQDNDPPAVSVTPSGTVMSGGFKVTDRMATVEQIVTIYEPAA